MATFWDSTNRCVTAGAYRWEAFRYQSTKSGRLPIMIPTIAPGHCRARRPSLTGRRSGLSGRQKIAVFYNRDLILTQAQGEKHERRTGERLATLAGKVSQLPTLIQIISAMLAIISVRIAAALGLVKVRHSL